MIFKNTENEYGLIAKLLHWLIGIAIIGMIAVGWYMGSMDNSDLKWQVYGLHKATGVVLLGLVGIRLGWRLLNIQPALPATMPQWQVIIHKLNLLVLYVTMVIMPVSGFLMSYLGGYSINVYGLFTINPLTNPNRVLGGICHDIHEVSAYVLTAAIIAHVGASLYHFFVVKDNVLQRMT